MNFGDVFAYALAQSQNLPLQFHGNDFAQTDIVPVADSAQRNSRWERENNKDEPPIIHQRTAS